MWVFDKIKFKNLFSHVDSEFKFRNGQCTVISGLNIGSVGYKNNGSGKSTLFEAISIALTGSSLRNIGKSDFINRDADEAYLEIDLHNDYLGKKLQIQRNIHRNKSEKVKIYENGGLNSQLVSVSEHNKFIFELMGITAEDLCRYFIISQDNTYNFITAGDAEKKDIINRITSVEFIQTIIENLKSDKRRLEGDYSSIDSEAVSYFSKIELLNEQLAILEEKASNDEEIKGLEEKITSIKNKIFESKKLIKTLNEEIKVKNSELNDLVAKRALKENQKQKLLKIEIEIGKVEDEKSDSIKLLNKMKIERESAIQCPVCKSHFILEREFDISLEMLDELIVETEKIIEGFKNSIDELEKEKSQYSTVKRDLIKLDSDIDNIESYVKSLNRKIRGENDSIEFSEKAIKKNDKRISELRDEQENNTEVLLLKEQISDFENKLKQLEERKLKIDEEYDMVNFWILNFDKKGFSTYLANKSIKVIEGMVNFYLQKFKADLSVLINGFKFNKDGTVREKIEVFVQEDGFTVTNFLNNSGGERQRILLSSILALQKLINMSLPNGGIDLLVLDESLWSVDEVGVLNAIDILSELKTTSFLVTQNIEDIESHNNINFVRVIKQNKISRYE